MYNPISTRMTEEQFNDGIRVHELSFDAITAPFVTLRICVQPGFSTPLDHHEVEECWIIAQGTGMLQYDGSYTRINKFNVIQFHSNKPHQVVNDSDEPLIIYSLSWWRD